jgi:hypothetical protein
VIFAVWLLTSAVIAVAITLDMHRLQLNRVGISRTGWIIACICTSPAAGIAYLWRRHAARKALISAVWKTIGDATEPLSVRRQRLITLRSNGLIGIEIYLACWNELEVEEWRDY